MAEIHKRRNLDAVFFCHKPKIIRCVVRNAERLEINIADTEFTARFDLDRLFFQRGTPFRGFAVAVLAAGTRVVKSVFGRPRNVNRTIDRSHQNAQTAGVVAVFVRDKNAVELGVTNVDLSQSPQNLTRAQARIDQNIGLFAGNQHSVAGRATAENGKFHLSP